MKTFITGSNGFLGKNLKTSLSHESVITAPSSKECNLLSENSLEDYSVTKYDLIIHLAAWTQAGDFCLKYPGDQWIMNQRINTNVLDWWRKKQNSAKLVFIGSSCVYSPELPLTEDNFMIGEPTESLYTYAMTKRMLYQGARSIGDQYGLKWLCFVPSTLYGPSYHNDGRQMHFIFDLIRKIIRGKEFGEQVILWGDGFQKRELVHVRDFVHRMKLLMNSCENEIINVGAGTERTIRDFAKIISNFIGFDSKLIVYDTSRYVGSRSKILSVEKISKIYPKHLSELTSLENGIKSVIEWFYEKKAYI